MGVWPVDDVSGAGCAHWCVTAFSVYLALGIVTVCNSGVEVIIKNVK